MAYYEVRIRPERKNTGLISRLKNSLAPKRLAYERVSASGLFFAPQNPLEKMPNANFFLADRDDGADLPNNKPVDGKDKELPKTSGKITDDLPPDFFEQRLVAQQKKAREDAAAALEQVAAKKAEESDDRGKKAEVIPSVRELIKKGEILRLVNLMRLGKLKIGREHSPLFESALRNGTIRGPMFDLLLDNFETLSITDTDLLEKIALTTLRRKPEKLAMVLAAYTAGVTIDKESIFRIHSFALDIFSIFNRVKGLTFRAIFHYASSMRNLKRAAGLFAAIAAVDGEAASFYIGMSGICVRNELVRIAMTSASQNGAGTAKHFKNYGLGIEPTDMDPLNKKKHRVKRMNELKHIYLAAYAQSRSAQNYADNIYPLIDKEKDVVDQMKRIDSRLKRNKRK